MWVCKEADFYNGVCPSLDVYICNSNFPCGNKISYTEYIVGQEKVLKAKAILEQCGYKIIKNVD